MDHIKYPPLENISSPLISATTAMALLLLWWFGCIIFWQRDRCTCRDLLNEFWCLWTDFWPERILKGVESLNLGSSFVLSINIKLGNLVNQRIMNNMIQSLLLAWFERGQHSNRRCVWNWICMFFCDMLWLVTFTSKSYPISFWLKADDFSLFLVLCTSVKNWDFKLDAYLSSQIIEFLLHETLGCWINLKWNQVAHTSSFLNQFFLWGLRFTANCKRNQIVVICLLKSRYSRTRHFLSLSNRHFLFFQHPPVKNKNLEWLYIFIPNENDDPHS